MFFSLTIYCKDMFIGIFIALEQIQQDLPTQFNLDFKRE